MQVSLIAYGSQPAQWRDFFDFMKLKAKSFYEPSGPWSRRLSRVM